MCDLPTSYKNFNTECSITALRIPKGAVPRTKTVEMVMKRSVCRKSGDMLNYHNIILSPLSTSGLCGKKK